MIRFAGLRAARGVSLIEVLIAIVIFSLGLIGLALMQLKGATFTKEAGSRTMAVLQARSLADRMQANPAGVADGGYVWSNPVPPGYIDCSTTACTPDNVATNDIAEWLGRIKAAAPVGSTGVYGTVANNANGTWTITVAWNGLVDIGLPTTDTSESVIFIPPQIGSSGS